MLALIELVLKRLRWAGQAISVDALIAWARVAVKLEPRPEPPAVAMTWLELEPHHAPETPQELERFADWLRLAELLQEHDPALLEKLEFPHRYTGVLADFADRSPGDEPVLERELRIETLDRLAELDPELRTGERGRRDRSGRSRASRARICRRRGASSRSSGCYATSA